MKKLFLIVFAVLLLNGCAGWDGQKQANQIQPINTTPQPVANQNTNQPQGIPYNDSMYGFSLTFPQTWKGFTTKNRTLDWGSFGTSDSIDFSLPDQEALFNISVHTKSQWQKIDAKSLEMPHPTYLGENDKYVFGYDQAQYAANDTMITRMNEIKDIVKTFKIVK